MIDVTSMGMEDVIHLSEIELPEGCTAVGDPDLVVVTVLTTKIEEVAPVVAAVEGEAGAAPADGATPAAGAAPAGDAKPTA